MNYAISLLRMIEDCIADGSIPDDRSLFGRPLLADSYDVADCHRALTYIVDGLPEDEFCGESMGMIEGDNLAAWLAANVETRLPFVLASPEDCAEGPDAWLARIHLGRADVLTDRYDTIRRLVAAHEASGEVLAAWLVIATGHPTDDAMNFVTATIGPMDASEARKLLSARCPYDRIPTDMVLVTPHTGIPYCTTLVRWASTGSGAVGMVLPWIVTAKPGESRSFADIGVPGFTVTRLGVDPADRA